MHGSSTQTVTPAQDQTRDPLYHPTCTCYNESESFYCLNVVFEWHGGTLITTSVLSLIYYLINESLWWTLSAFPKYVTHIFDLTSVGWGDLQHLKHENTNRNGTKQMTTLRELSIKSDTWQAALSLMRSLVRSYVLNPQVKSELYYTPLLFLYIIYTQYVHLQIQHWLTREWKWTCMPDGSKINSFH